MTDSQLIQAKRNARAQARQKAEAATPQLCREWGLGMTHAAASQPFWQSARTILCFSSFFPEPDTSPLLAHILQQGKTLCLPRMTGKPGEMEAHKVTPETQLLAGRFGILEPPKESPVIPAEEIDLILAPCVAASPGGVRLGHGGGFYDRYFARTDALRAVLCPSLFLFESLPCGPLDLPMQLIVTEEKILYPGAFHPTGHLL